MLHAILYCFRDFAHHPAGFLIFPNLAPRKIIFIIILVFPILPIIGTCNIAQTISDGVEHLLQSCFRLGGCQSHLLSISHIILLLLNCCLCVFNLLCCHSGLSFHIILDPFLLLFVASEGSFSAYPYSKRLLGSEATQCSKGSDLLCLRATLAFIRLLTSWCGALCWCAVLACR